MKIKFLKNTTLSYDGLNVRNYSVGQVYEPYHAQEKRVFEMAIKNGDAIPLDAAERPVEVKIAPPVETKEVPVLKKTTTRRAK
jgi:hypothetical protein